ARQAAGVCGAHLPPAALVNLAWDQAVAGVDPDLARRHLASCASCTEELALARESRALEGEDRVVAMPSRRPVLPRYLGLAASVAVAFLAGVVWQASREAGPAAAPAGEQARLTAR